VISRAKRQAAVFQTVNVAIKKVVLQTVMMPFVPVDQARHVNTLNELVM
jgi:hypothetical protein